MANTDTVHHNEVALVGRVTGPAAERVLPSGDTISSWRITIDRDNGSGHDVVTCTAWTARLRKSAGSWQKGDVVEIVGALRSRYWRSGAGLGSATEVEVHAATRVVAARVSRPRTRG
jgi:single-strand DNA-binding protein